MIGQDEPRREPRIGRLIDHLGRGALASNEQAVTWCLSAMSGELFRVSGVSAILYYRH